jgi:hypothetical protein
LTELQHLKELNVRYEEGSFEEEFEEFTLFLDADMERPLLHKVSGVMCVTA